MERARVPRGSTAQALTQPGNRGFPKEVAFGGGTVCVQPLGWAAAGPAKGKL